MSPREIDRGWKRIKNDLSKLNGSFTKVGIQQSSNTGDRGLSELAGIGAVHEFGAPRKSIPARPFMSTAFDENKQKLKILKSNIYDNIVRNRVSVRRGLGILGEFMTTKIKKKITDIKSPPLKNPSKKRSGGGTPNPLVDKGILRGSITHTEVIHGF